MSSPAPEASTLLTPPETPTFSHDQSGARVQHVSSIFRPDVALDPSASPDLVLVSSDCVLFYVHTQILLYASENAFAGQLAGPLPLPGPSSSAGRQPPALPTLHVPEDAPVLALILHALYGIDLPARSADLTLLSRAVDALLGRYAARAELVLAPGRPLFEALLAHAAVRPLHIYALAGHHELDALAVAASPHMLSFPLCLLTDEDAVQMGAVYLRRLFFLHLGRVEALKRLLRAAAAPPLHACAGAQLAAVRRAWALAIAALIHDARPDMSAQTIEATLGPLLGRVGCVECRDGLKRAVNALVAGWVAVKKTI